jgi:hypothetical protein
MGVRATINLISPAEYAAAVAQDFGAISTDGRKMDLDKAWHAIHYLLTGNTDLRFLLEGVQCSMVSEIVEAHSPASIAKLSEGLSKASTRDLMARFQPDVFNANRIYPDPWEGGSSEFDYIEENLACFVALVHEAAQAGKGIFVTIC